MTIIRIIGLVALLLLPCAISKAPGEATPRPHDTRETPHDAFTRCLDQPGIHAVNHCMLRDWR